MASEQRAAGTLRCWKVHDCVGCGCVYRYLFERPVAGEGSTRAAARQAAVAAAARALDAEVDARPCPQCGRLQPPMVGHEKAQAHGGLGCLAAVAFVVLVALGATDVMGRELAAYILGGVAALAGLAHLAVARADPNADPDRNRAAAERAVADGTVRVDRPGRPDDADPPPRAFGGPHLALLAVAAAAVPVTLAAPLLRAAGGWPTNPGVAPAVAGPGDEVTVTFPDEIRSVNGLWRGAAVATAENAADLGIPPAVDAAAAADAWGDAVTARSGDRAKKRAVWATLRLPDDPALAGQPLRVRVDLTATYPVDEGGGRFADETRSFTHTVELRLAAPGARAAYRQAWWGGVVGGGVMAVLAAVSLAGLASALKRQAPPAAVEPAGPPPAPPAADPDADADS